ncbi:MAG: DUF1844 domain-containing protein [Candidatus Hydrogenedentes bacterium]|nr:DUF1844 domain-containing protein [Candidatus Hydrogenedentota bacterium]
MAEDEPKIFIDEGWKAQVQREKEEALKQKAAPVADEEEQPDAEDEQQEIGEITFATLVESLATPAAFALGLIASPDSQKIMVNLAEAKFLIDMLLVLRTKTKNNLTSEEEGVLTETIAGLQRAYVMRAQQIQEAELKQAGINLGKPGTK